MIHGTETSGLGTHSTITYVETKTLTFKPGATGLDIDFETGLVRGVFEEGPAASLGIHVGMVIKQIDGLPYSEKLFRSRMAGSRVYTITFEVSSGTKPFTETKSYTTQGAMIHGTETSGTGTRSTISYVETKTATFKPGATGLDINFETGLVRGVYE